MTFAADDFAAIAVRIREIANEETPCEHEFQDLPEGAGRYCVKCSRIEAKEEPAT